MIKRFIVIMCLFWGLNTTSYAKLCSSWVEPVIKQEVFIAYCSSFKNCSVVFLTKDTIGVPLYVISSKKDLAPTIIVRVENEEFNREVKNSLGYKLLLNAVFWYVLRSYESTSYKSEVLIYGRSGNRVFEYTEHSDC